MHHYYTKIPIVADTILTAGTVAYAANHGMENDAMTIVKAKQDKN